MLQKRIKTNYTDLLILFIFIVILIIFSNFNDLISSKSFYYNTINILFLYNIFVGFILSQKITKNDILLINEKLVIFFLIIGLPFHFILIIYPDLVNYLINYTYGGISHKTLIILNTHISSTGMYEGRFMSFAWEPGIMQLLLNLALFNRLKRYNYKFDIYSFILVIGIILTFSTAGYFICFLVLLLTKQFFKPLFLLTLLITSPFIFKFIYDAIQFQITYKLINSNSFDGRYGRLFSLFKNWDYYHLIFGHGSNYYDLELKQQDLGGFDSFTNVIQRYGLISVLFLSICLFINNNKMVALILILTFLSQPIWSAPFIVMFYFRGNRSRINKILPNKKYEDSLDIKCTALQF